MTDELTKQMFDGLKLSEWDSVALNMNERIDLYYLFVFTVRRLQNENSNLVAKHAKLKEVISNLATE
jgi:hypothetical protein